jgi:hypothetical protein
MKISNQIINYNTIILLQLFSLIRNCLRSFRRVTGSEEGGERRGGGGAGSGGGDTAGGGGTEGGDGRPDPLRCPLAAMLKKEFIFMKQYLISEDMYIHTVVMYNSYR